MPKTASERVQKYRAAQRKAGLRPVQIWVPDVRAPQFAEEARRQAALVSQVDRAGDDQDFVEEISASWDDL